MTAEGIRAVIDGMAGFEAAATVDSGEKAVEWCAASPPDMVIMDVGLPGMNGVEATKRIRDAFPDTRVIVFTVDLERDRVLDLFRAGMAAYVLKDGPVSDLRLAVESVGRGGTYFSPKAPAVLMNHIEELEEGHLRRGDYEGMSDREIEVLRLLADGLSPKEVAARLLISHKTVESHKYNIMAKLKLRSMADLVKLAIRKKLVPL